MDNKIKYGVVSIVFLMMVSLVSAIEAYSVVEPVKGVNAVVKPAEVACTMDAKLCPDGTYVGRVAPDCEFAPCPGEDSDVRPTSSFGVYTDKQEYRVGEEAKITAMLSSNYLDVYGASVWAEVEYPDGDRDKISLERAICATSACDCPVCDPGEVCAQCICEPFVSCSYEGSIDVEEEGGYYITAYAMLDGETLKDRAKFSAYGSSETKYVRLGQKFELETKESAVVVDYGDMRLTLDDVVYSTGCANLQEDETIDCLDSSYALVSVRGPLWKYTTSSTGEANPITNTDETINMPTETQVRIIRGRSVSLFGAEISVLDLNGDEATFLVEKEGNKNYVEVKIDPSRQSVELGDMAEYKIIVKDLHVFPVPAVADSADSISAVSYGYRISVLDLPFGLRYDREISLRAGQQMSVPLYVDTSLMSTGINYEDVGKTPILKESIGGEATLKGVAVQAGINNAARTLKTVKVAASQTSVGAEITPVESTAVASGSVVGSRGSTPTVSAEAATETVKIAPDIVASGRAYKFRVVVTGEDGSQATAYGILNILYSPPPTPTEKVRIGLVQGWNLIALPGDGKLSSGTCSNMDELYAFVYIKENGEYMTLKEAADYMGEKRLKEYLKLHSFWVYSFKSCAMAFELEDATSFNDLSLDGGWNFVPVTSDMEGNSLSDIGGECVFERAYYWDAGNQDWRKMSPDQEFSGSMAYKGFVADVDDACDFGWGAIIKPPALPD